MARQARILEQATTVAPACLLAAYDKVQNHLSSGAEFELKREAPMRILNSLSTLSLLILSSVLPAVAAENVSLEIAGLDPIPAYDHEMMLAIDEGGRGYLFTRVCGLTTLQQSNRVVSRVGLSEFTRSTG